MSVDEGVPIENAHIWTFSCVCHPYMGNFDARTIVIPVVKVSLLLKEVPLLMWPQ